MRGLKNKVYFDVLGMRSCGIKYVFAVLNSMVVHVGAMWGGVCEKVPEKPLKFRVSGTSVQEMQFKSNANVQRRMHLKRIKRKI